MEYSGEAMIDDNDDGDNGVTAVPTACEGISGVVFSLHPYETTRSATESLAGPYHCRSHDHQRSLPLSLKA